MSNATTASNTWADAFFEHFSLFQPEWGRRPYVRETEAEIVAAIDDSLFGTNLTLEAKIGDVEVRHSFSAQGPWIRHSFSLADIPKAFSILVNITLILSNGEKVVHPRHFSRAVPPTATAATCPVVWQVDHTRRSLRADGIPWIANGWFSGSYDHESAGIPTRLSYPFNRSGQTADAWRKTQASLSQQSRTVEWGRHGNTFMRTGFGYMPSNLTSQLDPSRWDTNMTNAMALLDAAAASGVPVLLNIGIDSLAQKNFNKSTGGIDPRITPPNPDLTDCAGEPYCGK
jgi:hypothetical protein